MNLPTYNNVTALNVTPTLLCCVGNEPFYFVLYQMFQFYVEYLECIAHEFAIRSTVIIENGHNMQI